MTPRRRHRFHVCHFPKFLSSLFAYMPCILILCSIIFLPKVVVDFNATSPRNCREGDTLCSNKPLIDPKATAPKGTVAWEKVKSAAGEWSTCQGGPTCPWE